MNSPTSMYLVVYRHIVFRFYGFGKVQLNDVKLGKNPSDITKRIYNAPHHFNCKHVNSSLRSIWTLKSLNALKKSSTNYVEYVAIRSDD